MITLAITSYKEEKTIGRAIQALEEQGLKDYEIIVAAPDQGTLEAAREAACLNKRIKVIKDGGRGKPSAMNLIARKAKGRIIVFTDGDVYVGEKSIKPMIELMDDVNIGAVTGRPISTNFADNKFGFWARVLTETAHRRRMIAFREGRRFFCSGYLFAIRKNLLVNLPEDLLSEDGYISHFVYQQGYRIAYSPESKVYVKYPDNFIDWVKQKKRSAGGYNQIRKMIGVEIRSFKSEASGGLSLLSFASRPREFFWLVGLFMARIYLWIAIYKDINIKKKSQREIWQRVESTK